MSHWRAHQGERKIIGIGISKRTMRDLLEGQVKTIRGEDVGFDGDIMLLGGDTEADIAKRVRSTMAPGTIWTPPGTKIQ